MRISSKVVQGEFVLHVRYHASPMKTLPVLSMEEDTEDLVLPGGSPKLASVVESGPSTPLTCQSEKPSPGSRRKAESPPVITTAYIMSKFGQQGALSSDSGFSYGSSEKLERRLQSHELGLRKRFLNYRTEDQDYESDCRVTDSSSVTDSDSVCGVTQETFSTAEKMRQPFRMPDMRDLPSPQPLVMPRKDLLSDLGLPMLPLHTQIPQKFGRQLDEYHTTAVKKMRITPIRKLQSANSIQKTPVRLKAPDTATTSSITPVQPSQLILYSQPVRISGRESSVQFGQLTHSLPQLSTLGEMSSLFLVQGEGTSSADSNLCVATSSSNGSSKEQTRELKRKRFLHTKNALEKSGLLDVTMKTAKLIKENTLLQNEIDNLKKQTSQFIQNIVAKANLQETELLGLATLPQHCPSIDSLGLESDDINESQIQSPSSSSSVTVASDLKQEPPEKG